MSRHEESTPLYIHRKKSPERRAGLAQVQSFQFKLILYLGCVQKNAKRSVRLTHRVDVWFIFRTFHFTIWHWRCRWRCFINKSDQQVITISIHSKVRSFSFYCWLTHLREHNHEIVHLQVKRYKCPPFQVLSLLWETADTRFCCQLVIPT